MYAIDPCRNHPNVGMVGAMELKKTETQLRSAQSTSTVAFRKMSPSVQAQHSSFESVKSLGRLIHLPNSRSFCTLSICFAPLTPPLSVGGSFPAEAGGPGPPPFFVAESRVRSFGPIFTRVRHPAATAAKIMGILHLIG